MRREMGRREKGARRLDVTCVTNGRPVGQVGQGGTRSKGPISVWVRPRNLSDCHAIGYRRRALHGIVAEGRTEGRGDRTEQLVRCPERGLPMKHGIDIYGGHPASEVPTYNFAEAARYLHIATATLRSWVLGRPYPRRDKEGFFQPLIRLPEEDKKQLSFSNLVEAHVLWALRTTHSVSMHNVRAALDFAEAKLGINRLLLSPELRTDAGDLFLEKYGELLNLSKSGQLAMKKILEAYLDRVEWDIHRPSRLFPFIAGEVLGSKVIVIDPLVSFGRPVVARKAIGTSVIVSRIDAGETVEDLALDYGLDPSEIEEAILYEQAA